MRKAMKDGCHQRTLTPCESWSAESNLFGMFVLGCLLCMYWDHNLFKMFMSIIKQLTTSFYMHMRGSVLSTEQLYSNVTTIQSCMY